MNRGFIFLGNIVALLLAIFTVSFYMSQRVDQSQFVRRRGSNKGFVESLIFSIDAALKSQSSYINTMKSSLNKSGANLERCLNDPAYDCPIGVYPFSVLDDSGATIIDSSTTSSGFDANYNPCNTFDAPISASCTIRYQMTWEPTCTAAPCYNPQIQVKGRLLIQTNDKAAINLKTNEYDTSFNLR